MDKKSKIKKIFTKIFGLKSVNEPSYIKYKCTRCEKLKTGTKAISGIHLP